MDDAGLTLLLDAALAAGRAMLEVYRSPEFGVEWKEDRSPLTRADRAAHEIILTRLADTGLPVLSEESRALPVAERQGWPRYWLVDPLDGTKEFIRRNGEFTVNIALIEGTAPACGVVYAPAQGRIYWGDTATCAAAWAEVTESARAGDARAASRPLPDPANAGRGGVLRVVASRSHGNEATEAFIRGLEAVYGPAERIPSGSSLKICRVAEGTADLYPRLAPTMEWDTAAAQAVLEAAGGRVVEYDTAFAAPDYLDSALPSLRPLRYTKPSLLNPFFVALAGPPGRLQVPENRS